MKSDYVIDQLQVVKNGQRTVKSDSKDKIMTVQNSRNQVHNGNNGKNPGAGGLFDEALIRQVNLAAAFHDHISCTKLPSELSKAGGFFGINGPFNGAFFGNAFSNNEDKEQIKMLKEMILVHLDLIQQQSEQLLKKERQLLGLKHDREALCVRLDKMEKRVGVLTRKLLAANELAAKQLANQAMSKPSSLGSTSPTDNSNSVDSTIFSSYFNDNENSLFDNDVELHTNEEEPVEPLESQGLKPTKKRSKKSDKDQSPRKRNKKAKSIDSENSTLTFNNNSNSSFSLTGSKSGKESKKISIKKRRSTISITKSIPEVIEEVIEDLPPVKSAIPREIFITEDDYDVITVRESMTKVAITNAKELDCDTSDTLPVAGTCLEEVEVPSFRVVNIPIAQCPEGIENIDDEVFIKRHSKLEIEERRRKRWDLQRLREQKHMDKLKQGRYYSGSAFIGPEKPSIAKKKMPEIESFYPEPHDAHFIEVCDKLPLIAFGHPIPKLSEKPFCLPWPVSTSRASSSKCKGVKKC
ncbi:Male-specific lethal 1-like 1 [Halotydeus destructor]|nr:Male-specific lethal 1-like 1 [Halotydeus destructor]